MNDFAYRDLFFFMTCTVVHIGVPKVFPVVIIYLYMFVVIGHMVLFAVGQYRFLFITYLIKNVLVICIFMTLLVDNWCDFYIYRDNSRYSDVKS